MKFSNCRTFRLFITFNEDLYEERADRESVSIRSKGLYYRMGRAISNLQSIYRQLMTLEQPKKPKMLVVDDEPDNLDLLYRTFRRDFHVIKADSGMSALEILATQGEVAVIISDQRMPEMKGTEFLSKTLPEFPDTMRIILTGFTDIEDLVEAINSGQVYKYITKPWDPGELKAVVQRAAETYELLKQRTEEARRSQTQVSLLTKLVQIVQTVDREAYLEPRAEAFGETFKADRTILQLVKGNHPTSARGTYGTSPSLTENWLAQEPLTSEAIATQQPQISVNVPSNARLAESAHYSARGIEAHLIVPITYQAQVLAVLSLQWEQPRALREDELQLIHVSAQLVGIALAHPSASN
jgi:CheY-like chemotaxis protein